MEQELNQVVDYTRENASLWADVLRWNTSLRRETLRLK